jgi:hypothetical protein
MSYYEALLRERYLWLRLLAWLEEERKEAKDD